MKPVGLTEAQRGSADSYTGGEVIRFHQNSKGFTRGERVTVTEVSGGGVQVVRANGQRAALPLAHADRFEVYAARRLTLAAGDRLRITMNGSTAEVTRSGKRARSRLTNGDVFEVAGFTRQGDIRLSNGFVVPADYGGLAQGYAVTSHAAQGSTVDRVLIALGSQSLTAANRQQFYVSVSRGREAVRLYTDDKQGLREAVRTDASRLSATELLLGRQDPPNPRPGGASKLFAMRRARQADLSWRERAQQAPWMQSHLPNEVRHGRH